MSLTSIEENDAGWCTIESDPGVFTELIEDLGAKGFQVEELYGLEESFLIPSLEPVYGLIFLFKWDAQVEKRTNNGVIEQEKGTKAYDDSSEMFFARQTIHNACATQAILSILFNLPQPSSSSLPPYSLGIELENFRTFAMELPPYMRGEAIGSCDLIRTVHNSFVRPELTSMQSSMDLEERKRRKLMGHFIDDEDETPFHFVSLIPVKGRVYEFDGLKEGPVDHGAPEGEKSWISLAINVIQEKIGSLQGNGEEIRFNLMAIIGDKMIKLEKELSELENNLFNKSRESSSNFEREIAQIKDELQAERYKREQWKKENARRRHNFIPLIFATLKEMAKHGLLEKFVSNSR